MENVVVFRISMDQKFRQTKSQKGNLPFLVAYLEGNK